MTHHLNAVAVIPARGGSKRIPRKNIRDFRGRPLISWAIECALSSGLFGDVVVSTDDAEIARIAISAGASVPFMRPPDLADDQAALVPTVADAIWRMGLALSPDQYVCCLLPGAMGVDSADLIASFELLQASNFSGYCSAITRYSHPVQRAFAVDSHARIQPLDERLIAMRTQDLETLWHDAGQFYWASTKTWLEVSDLLPNSIGFELPNWRVQDIDTEEDWVRAEIAHQIATTLRTMRTSHLE